MKFLLDECLSHAFAQRPANSGYPDSVHPIHLGLLMAEDHVIVRRALREDRVVITANADDFRTLLSRETVHPGLITLPNAEREDSWRLLQLALAFIELQPSPADYMVNRVIEVSADEGIRPYELPRPD